MRTQPPSTAFSTAATAARGAIWQMANAAGVLLAAGVAGTWRDGVERAAAAIDNGKAAQCLERLVAISNHSTGS